MASVTGWKTGRGENLTWGTAIASADIASMLTANTCVANLTITNGTALDMFADLSVRCAIASSTTVAGANLAFWIFALLDDGSTYGDGQFTVGTKAALTPTFAPCAVIPLVAAASTVNLIGFASGIIIPPGSFKFAMQNNSGFTLTSGTQTVQYRTYNIDLNST